MIRRRAAGGLLALLLGCGGARHTDVIYLPSSERVVERMLELARVGPGDLLFDLGCGDGRIAIAAARDRGARAVCNDVDPARIADSRRNARTAGVADRIRLDQGDLFELDLGDATVVTLYLSPALNLRLRPKLFRELRPGGRVVSHNFDMADWRPDRTVTVDWPTGGTSAVHLWVVPADVAGTWELLLATPGGDRRYRVRLEQEFQRLSGTSSLDGRALSLTEPAIRGDSIAFTLGDSLRLRGRMTGGLMAGTYATPSDSGSWRAFRPY